MPQLTPHPGHDCIVRAGSLSYRELSIPRPTREQVEAAGPPVYPWPDLANGSAAAWVRLLEQESGPLWPDPYDFDAPPRSAWRNKPERVGRAEPWLFSRLDEHRKGAWWTQPPGCVVCHALQIRADKIMRTQLYKSLGWWTWRVDHLLAGAGPSASSGAGAGPPPPLLALAPEAARELRIASEQQWAQVTLHMAAVSLPPCCRCAEGGKGGASCSSTYYWSAPSIRGSSAIEPRACPAATMARSAQQPCRRRYCWGGCQSCRQCPATRRSSSVGSTGF